MNFIIFFEVNTVTITMNDDMLSVVDLTPVAHALALIVPTLVVHALAAVLPYNLHVLRVLVRALPRILLSLQVGSLGISVAITCLLLLFLVLLYLLLLFLGLMSTCLGYLGRIIAACDL